MKTRVAVLDDERRLAEILRMLLRRDGYLVSVYTDSEEFCNQREQWDFDLLITDLKMPKIDGLEVLRVLREWNADVPVLMMTAHATVKTAIEAMKLGAFDYIEKPFDNDNLRALVERALSYTRLSRENRYLRAELKQKYALDRFVAQSEVMTGIMALAQRAARSRATVLIEGESGAGKEMLARFIHVHSPRVAAPFIAVNCKALSEGVLESELFGHEKGAFTGADRRKLGLFERAQGGTVFLDELGEVGDSFQAKLLRVLQEREIQRVGSATVIPIDVRVIAATNKNLKDEVKSQRFREDLYFRLAVIPITLPPLRDRRADILPLARVFLEKYNEEMQRRLEGWSEAVEEYLLSHSWPGNVRELENTLERAVVLARDDKIQWPDLMIQESAARSLSAEEAGLGFHEYMDLKAAERISKVLESVEFRRREAAELLGIDRSTLYRLMKKYKLA